MSLNKLQELVEELVLHDELNPVIWDKNKLRPEIRTAMLKITDAFIEFLKIDKKLVKDIYFTGSNANFNFHADSDIDLHVEVDTKKYSCLDIMEYFNAKKTLWNEQHNITIKGYSVELYAETYGDHDVTNAGIYSVMNNKWLKEPKKFEGEIDQESIDRKANSIKKQIDDIIIAKVDKVETIQKLKENIRNLRKTGIQKGGEYSTNNLAFKELRNSGYLEKLSDYSKNLTDNLLSLK